MLPYPAHTALRLLPASLHVTFPSFPPPAHRGHRLVVWWRHHRQREQSAIMAPHALFPRFGGVPTLGVPADSRRCPCSSSRAAPSYALFPRFGLLPPPRSILALQDSCGANFEGGNPRNEAWEGLITEGSFSVSSAHPSSPDWVSAHYLNAYHWCLP